MKKACIHLEDGSCLEGNSVGANGTVSGELVFNTSMTGYQEIMTDPSYAGQIVMFTAPHIGNYGTNPRFEESGFHIKGIIARSINRYFGGATSRSGITEYLKKNKIFAIDGVDTRFLTKKIRDRGVLKVILSDEIFNGKYPNIEIFEYSDTKNLVNEVSCSGIYRAAPFRNGIPHLVLLDFGVKRSILKFLTEVGFNVTVAPCTISYEELRSLAPTALFLSNGPGDPKNVKNGIALTHKFLGSLPILGICLGHQILALSSGADTYKLKFGHHGGNHPVKDLTSEKIYITTQNHNYAVLEKNLPNEVEITMRSLFDNSIEGIKSGKYKFISVQFHPESTPGPLDAQHIFSDFRRFVNQA